MRIRGTFSVLGQLGLGILTADIDKKSIEMEKHIKFIGYFTYI